MTIASYEYKKQAQGANVNNGKRYPARLLLAGLMAVIAAGCSRSAAKAGPAYIQAVIERGSIEKTVSGSGSLEPVSSVNVLAQMSGIAEKVYADYNDHVVKGQVLVELNTDMLRLQRVGKKAAVCKARAQYDLQLSQYTTQLKLAEKKLISDYELQSSRTTLEMYSAELNSADADLSVIDTEISQYAIIKSPISGIVLARNVDSGTSVVEGSSSNSSSLFTIAEDLTRMQIETLVDEIDIASVGKGQRVRFSVGALPGRRFTGQVRMVRLMPETADNVVSYSVVVDVDNSEGSLLPGMTAEVDFIVDQQDGVLLVPNAALRYEPSGVGEDQGGGNDGANVPRSTGLASLVMGSRPRGMRIPRSTGDKSARAKQSAKGVPDANKTLWYLDETGKPAFVNVVAGISDGSNTAVTSERDLEGMKIIVREGIK